MSDPILTKAHLIERALIDKAGILSQEGALLVKTGECTGRSTKERFLVQHKEIEDQIDWGSHNQPLSVEKGEEFFAQLKKSLSSLKTYKMQGYVGCFRISVLSTSPWHIAFAQNMFRKKMAESLIDLHEDFTKIDIKIWHAPELHMSDLGISFPYKKAVILDPLKKEVGIVGSAYAGEIKKSAFSLCNFILPHYGLFPMHASANCWKDGSHSSVLFGLSGTGKTTLSADPNRYLIGDDEIVWSEEGLSNLEGGCYAKLIHLDEKKEKEIFRASNRFGSILENVVFDSKTKEIHFDDDSITENTRGSYSLEALNKVYPQNKKALPPKSLVFLTADAFGAFPPVARLNPWQAQFYFTSGYTAKVSGTEIGVTEPQAVFSTCFGAPFMPQFASVYAGLLAKFVKKAQSSVWILNTGWTKGGYEKGERFPISVSRKILKCIQSGVLEHVPKKIHPIFGFEVPEKVPGLDSHWLMYSKGAEGKKLSDLFIQNAKKNSKMIPKEILQKGGPLFSSASFETKEECLSL